MSQVKDTVFLGIIESLRSDLTLGKGFFLKGGTTVAFAANGVENGYTATFEVLPPSEKSI